MYTFDYYLNEVAKEEGYLHFSPGFMTDEEPLRLSREAARRYAKQIAQDALNRAADESAKISGSFFVESRELQEKSTSEYANTLLEGQVIGSLSVGQAVFDSIKNTEIILP